VSPFRFRYPDDHGVPLDVLLLPAASPLLVQDAGKGAKAPDTTSAPPDDDCLTLAPNLVRMESSSPAACPYDSSPVAVSLVLEPAFNNAPSHENSAVDGTAHVHATAPTAVSKEPSRRNILDPVPHPIVVAHDEGHTRTMVTRWSSATVIKPPNWRNLSAMMSTSISLVPSDCHSDNRTWKLVPCPSGANIVSGKQIFKHKFNSDGTHSRHKAQWVVRRYSQRSGVDYDETFNAVDKPATICLVLSIAVSRSWPIHPLDIKNDFLYGNLEETVYCQQPHGFINSNAPDSVCLLQKSLYGLKQALRA
jgi:hypothetical protein